MTSHTDKALTTMTTMSTVATDWKLCEIRWVEEVRQVMGEVTCPGCRGHKNVRKGADGQVMHRPEGLSCKADAEWSQAARETAHDEGRMYGNCETCRTKQRGFTVAKGKVPGLVMAKVMVGYPVWPAGVKFDSRFSTGCDCHLCGKFIMKSLRVPVCAVGANGQGHGMWVGQDCARKFLAAKVPALKAEPRGRIIVES